VCQGVAVFVVFASESLVVISAIGNWALLRPLGHMGKHMGLEILEWPATVRVRAAGPLLSIVLVAIAIGSWAFHGVTGVA